MKIEAVHLMDDGQRLGVDVDWKLEARLKDEYRSEKNDEDAVDDLRASGVLAPGDDKLWFREHPARRAYIRMFVRQEMNIFPFRMLDPDEHLVVVMRVRAKDLHPYYPPDKVMAAEAAGHIVVSREPFRVKDSLNDVDIYHRMEGVLGPDNFDTALRLWVRTTTAPMQARPDGSLTPISSPYLQFWQFDQICEEIYPGSTQVLNPLGSPLA